MTLAEYAREWMRWANETLSLIAQENEAALRRFVHDTSSDDDAAVLIKEQ